MPAHDGICFLPPGKNPLLSLWQWRERSLGKGAFALLIYSVKLFYCLFHPEHKWCSLKASIPKWEWGSLVYVVGIVFLYYRPVSPPYGSFSPLHPHLFSKIKPNSIQSLCLKHLPLTPIFSIVYSIIAKSFFTQHPGSFLIVLQQFIANIFGFGDQKSSVWNNFHSFSHFFESSLWPWPPWFYSMWTNKMWSLCLYFHNVIISCMLSLV